MSTTSIRTLIQRDRTGDPRAAEELVPLVYDQLRSLAARYLRGERSDHTLRPTALVHEAYLRLAEADMAWEDRVHFLAVAANVMRRVLVDYARSKGRQKRGDGALHVPIDDASGVMSEGIPLLTDIDEALTKLATFDVRKSRIIELIYFGGLTHEEAAGVLDISVITIYREMRLAKAWLKSELESA